MAKEIQAFNKKYNEVVGPEQIKVDPRDPTVFQHSLAAVKSRLDLIKAKQPETWGETVQGADIHSYMIQTALERLAHQEGRKNYDSAEPEGRQLQSFWDNLKEKEADLKEFVEKNKTPTAAVTAEIKRREAFVAEFQAIFDKAKDTYKAYLEAQKEVCDARAEFLKTGAPAKAAYEAAQIKAKAAENEFHAAHNIKPSYGVLNEKYRITKAIFEVESQNAAKPDAKRQDVRRNWLAALDEEYTAAKDKDAAKNALGAVDRALNGNPDPAAQTVVQQAEKDYKRCDDNLKTAKAKSAICRRFYSALVEPLSPSATPEEALAKKQDYDAAEAEYNKMFSLKPLKDDSDDDALVVGQSNGTPKHIGTGPHSGGFPAPSRRSSISSGTGSTPSVPPSSSPRPKPGFGGS